MRTTTSKIGAMAPICAAVGSKPIAHEPMPIISIVVNRLDLRPSRSPSEPNRIPPSGRAM